jgi:hypothetical protein
VPLPQVGNVGGEAGLVADAIVGVPQASDDLDRLPGTVHYHDTGIRQRLGGERHYRS